MNRLVAAALLAGMTTLGTTRARADQTVWDVVKDFSVAHNPNGAWKYSGDHNILHHAMAEQQHGGVESYTNIQNPPDGTTISRNVNSHAVKVGSATIPPDHLLMDPQDGITNIFWEAPTAGTYTLTGDFRPLTQTVELHYVHIDVLGHPARLFDGSLGTGSRPIPFSFTLKLAKGDTLNFTVQAGDSDINLATGLAAHIVAVP